MEKGWVKLYRSILENSFLMNDDSAYLVFTKLILLVDQRTGSWSGGRRQLGGVVRMNDNTLKDVLKRLKSNGIISIEGRGRFSKYTITNWTVYQNRPNGGEQKRAPRKILPGEQRSFADLTGGHPKDTHMTPTKTPTRTPTNNSSKSNNRHPQKHPHQHQDDTGMTPLLQEKEKEGNSDKSELAVAAEYGKPEINEAFSYWQDVIGYPITSKVKANRNACSNLIKRHTVDGVQKLVRGVNAAQNDPYGPRISDFVELQSNLNKLLDWGKRKGNAERIPSL